MKLGKKDVTELYLELEREREVRQDFIADTRNITFSTNNSVSMVQLVLKMMSCHIAYRSLPIDSLQKDCRSLLNTTKE